MKKEREVAEKGKKELDELEWKRLLDPDVLPYKLVEDLKKEEYTTDEVYRYLNSLCCVPQGSFIPNKRCHLWILLKEKEKVIKGFCWIVIHPLFKEAKIELLSILKELRAQGGALKKLVELVEKLREEEKIRKVVWDTPSVEIAKKYGFVREKNVRMRYEGESIPVKEEGEK